MTYDVGSGGPGGVEETLTLEGPVEPPEGSVLSHRTFWGIFAAAWVAYGALFCSVMIADGGMPLGDVLLGALGTVAGPALPGVALALRRRDLLNPDRGIGRTVGLHVLVGIAYALTATVLATLIFMVLPSPLTNELGEQPGMIVLARLINGMFLYAILLGFLMWTASFERIHESRALAAREAVLRAQAEAKAVRAQFNPHFVFNTLHSLMLLVRADPDRAERAIEDVAELIRYASTLQRREVDHVSLGKELEFARRYVSLEELRLEDRLQVQWAVDDSLHDAMVPAFSLQTLLENAIKHGIAPRPEGGRVRIVAERNGAGLRLAVEDDGTGADPSRVATLEGHGLDLLRRRLESVYDGQASLAWETAPARGFAATLLLPHRRADGAEPTGRATP